jgi:hypothetical protein
VRARGSPEATDLVNLSACPSGARLVLRQGAPALGNSTEAHRHRRHAHHPHPCDRGRPIHPHPTITTPGTTDNKQTYGTQNPG